MKEDVKGGCEKVNPMLRLDQCVEAAARMARVSPVPVGGRWLPEEEDAGREQGTR